MGPLRDYQRGIFLPGTAMAAILLASVAAAVIGRRPPARRLRGEAMLFGFAALLLPMTAAVTTMFDYRFALPAIPPLCAAVGMAGLWPPTACERGWSPAFQPRRSRRPHRWIPVPSRRTSAPSSDASRISSRRV